RPDLQSQGRAPTSACSGPPTPVTRREHLSAATRCASSADDSAHTAGLGGGGLPGPDPVRDLLRSASISPPRVPADPRHDGGRDRAGAALGLPRAALAASGAGEPPTGDR